MKASEHDMRSPSRGEICVAVVRTKHSAMEAFKLRSYVYIGLAIAGSAAAWTSSIAIMQLLAIH